MSLTINRNVRFEKRPNESEKQTISREWSRSVAGSQAEAIKRDLERGPDEIVTQQIRDLIEALLQQIAIDSERVPAQIRELFPRTTALNQLVLGKFKYPFSSEAQAAFVAEYQTLVVDRLQRLDLRGRGNSYDEAFADLSSRFHAEFQRLDALLPGEMKSEDEVRWQIFNDIVDVHHHKDLTPIEFRKIGKVVSRSPFKVRWWGDDEDTSIDLAKAPAKLASFEIGTRFEAIVEFDRKRQRIKRILAVEFLPPVTEPAREQTGVAGLEGLTKVAIEEI